MEVGWILIFIFAFCTMIFIALALFAPEWVGISSSKTKKEEDALRKASESSAPQPAANDSEKTPPK